MSARATKKRRPSKRATSKRSATKKRPKKKAKEEKKEETAASETGTAKVEALPAPWPFVLARHEHAMQEREARGYSRGELESAGLTFVIARRSKVPVDLRRRSVLDGNVARLKEWYVPEPKKAVPKKEKEEAEKAPKKAAKRKKKAATAKK